jgi:hypothetical protein
MECILVDEVKSESGIIEKRDERRKAGYQTVTCSV